MKRSEEILNIINLKRQLKKLIFEETRLKLAAITSEIYKLTDEHREISNGIRPDKDITL